MPLNDLLSQEEVDALLAGLESGDLETEGPPVRNEGVPYDLENADNPLSGTPRALSRIYEGFVTSFRKQLSELLNHPVDLVFEGIDRIEFSEYLEDKRFPQSFNIISASSLNGWGVIFLSAELISVMVDVFFGGDGVHALPIENRDFSRAEKRIARLTLDRAFPCLSQAWDPVVRTIFNFEKSESTPEFIDIASPKDVVFAARFRITLEGRSGEFHVTMPYSMLELVKQGFRDLRTNTEAADKDWPKELHAAVHEINVELTGALVETELTLGEIINLKQGDIITVSIPERVCLRTGHIALFKGVYGQNKGHNSVRITEKLSGSSATTKWKDSNAEKRLQ